MDYRRFRRTDDLSNGIELRSGERQFRGVIEASTDAIIVADEKEHILIWNHAAELLFGYTKQEVIGKDFIRLIVPESYRNIRAAAYQRAIKRKKLSYKGQIVEAEGMRKDGTLFPLEHTVSMWTIEGQVRFVAILRDVTAHNETKHQLQKLNEDLEARVRVRTRELEQVNKELRDFAYIISHDLKAPLRSVHQLAQWISADYEKRFDDQGRKLIKLLFNRVERMHHLIDGVLEYSRVGRVKEKLRKVDLNILIADIIELIGLPDHFQVHIDENLPEIMAEQPRIKGLFLNLLDNAVKFNDKPQAIIEIKCRDQGDNWLFSVSDNGCGIAQRHQQKIFDIFQTLDSSDQHTGTGFGLSLVKKIVETAGGEIRVESREGQGTAFLFTWPKVLQKQ